MTWAQHHWLLLVVVWLGPVCAPWLFLPPLAILATLVRRGES